MADTQQVDPKTDRKVARLAKQISAFSKEHGGAEGQVAYIGERGARIVLVGEDGAWGDLVAPSYTIAEKAVEKAAHHGPRGLRRRVRGQGPDGPVRVEPHGGHPGRRPEQRLTNAAQGRGELRDQPQATRSYRTTPIRLSPRSASLRTGCATATPDTRFTR